MKKIILFILMAAVIGLPIIAKGQTEEDSDKTILEMHVLAEQDVNEFMKHVISEWETANPGYRIKLVTRENDAYKTAIQVSVGSGDPPDIFFVWSGEYAGKFVRNGQVSDLTSYYESEWGNTITDAARTPFEMGRKIWAVPYSVETKVFYYNKELFRKAGVEVPETWEDLISAGKKLDSINVIPLINGGVNAWQSCHYISLLNQKILGASKLVKDYNLQRPREELFTDPGYITALNYFKGLKDEGLFPQNIASVDYETAQALFYSERAAMFYGGSWNMAVWDGKNSAAPPEFAEKWGMFPMPVINAGAGDQGYTLGAPIGLAVSSQSEHKEAAVSFLQFFTNVENQQSFVAETARLPAVKGAVTSDNSDEKVQWMANHIENATGMVGWLDTVLEISVSNVYLNGLVSLLNGSKTPEEIMEETRNQAQIVQDEIGPILY